MKQRQKQITRLVVCDHNLVANSSCSILKVGWLMTPKSCSRLLPILAVYYNMNI